MDICKTIKEFILENNNEDAQYVFRVITFDNEFIDIEPNPDLKIEYDDKDMTFYHGNKKVGEMSVEELNCVFLEDIED